MTGMDPTLARAGLLILAVGCGLVAVLVPGTASVATPAALAFLGMAIPTPGARAAHEAIGAAKEAAAQAVDMTTVPPTTTLPPVPPTASPK